MISLLVVLTFKSILEILEVCRQYVKRILEIDLSNLFWRFLLNQAEMADIWRRTLFQIYSGDSIDYPTEHLPLNATFKSILEIPGNRVGLRRRNLRGLSNLFWRFPSLQLHLGCRGLQNPFKSILEIHQGRHKTKRNQDHRAFKSILEIL